MRHYSKLNDERVSLVSKLQRILRGQIPGSEITTAITSKRFFTFSPLYTLALEARVMSVLISRTKRSRNRQEFAVND